MLPRSANSQFIRPRVLRSRKCRRSRSRLLRGGVACILVVDSFDPTRAVTADALRRNGFTVHDVADDDEAASLLAAEAVDLVLLDLPLEDPIELAAEIRRGTGARPGPRIFALVDRAATPQRGRARQAGVDFFLLRPCPPVALLKHLSRML